MAPFVLFGRSHLIASLLSLATPVVLVALTRTNRNLDKPIRWTLAAILVGVWLWWYVLAYRRGWLTVGDALPMNLCDWATIMTIVTLLYPGQRTYELAYFWALGGTVQGMITPDTPYDFPEARFIIFFVYHGGIVAAVLYLTFGLRLRPWPQSILRVVLWSFIYLLAAGVTDIVLGTNYGFLRAPAAQASLFNFLSPWPYYIPELIALGFASAAIYYGPWFIADRIRAARMMVVPSATPRPSAKS
jgi:hypothetical integral membrane protein (TIGR02206 family)